MISPEHRFLLSPFYKEERIYYFAPFFFRYSLSLEGHCCFPSLWRPHWSTPRSGNCWRHQNYCRDADFYLLDMVIPCQPQEHFWHCWRWATGKSNRRKTKKMETFWCCEVPSIFLSFTACLCCLSPQRPLEMHSEDHLLACPVFPWQFCWTIHQSLRSLTPCWDPVSRQNQQRAVNERIPSQNWEEACVWLCSISDWQILTFQSF